MRFLASTLVLFVVAISAVAGPPQAKPLSFGVVPQQSALKLARAWSPLIERISARTGYQLRFKTARDINNFESRLYSSEYDFAYMNPYHYTVFSQHPGYQAIAMERDRKLQGIIVVAKDSPITQLEDLQNKRLAFPSPAAFAASILTRTELRKRNIAFDPAYVGSHDSVYHAVARGLYPAGGGIQRTLDSLNPEIRKQLQVLWTTEPHTPHAIAVHPRVPKQVRDAVLAALLELGQSEEEQSMLNEATMNGFQAAEDAQWDDIRGLGIGLLNDLVRTQR